MRSFLKKLLIITIELAVITGALWFIAQKKGIKSASQVVPALESKLQEAKKLPQLPAQTNPETKTFNWQYKNANYSLNLTLYKSTYDYYSVLPKVYSYSGTLPQNWEEQYYSMFLNGNEQDKTISELAESLRSLGQKHKLTDDQIVDLTLSFVQSIPYDDAKAKQILSQDGSVKMLYPYEVLWLQEGVCSDKSILAYALLKELGYGSALFIYEQNNHMAVAVECPKNYSTYSSGYCYAETTSTGNKIGIIPSIDAQTNKTIDLSQYSPDQMQSLNLQELGDVKTLLPTQGKQYSGIINTQKTMDEINSLKNKISKMLSTLQSLKKKINSQESELEDMKSDLEKYKDQQNVEKYNNLAEDFNDLAEKYREDVKEYNEQVLLYNGYIKKYNALIKQ